MAENLVDDDSYWRELLVELNKEKLKDYPKEKIQKFIETGEGAQEINAYIKQKKAEMIVQIEE